MQINNQASISDAINQYTSIDGVIGATLYIDPFNLPSFYHPTYETCKDGIRFNPNVKVAGYKCTEFHNLHDIYAMMLNCDFERNVKLAYQSLLFRNKLENVQENVLMYGIEACFRLKGKNGKSYYYKRSSIENGMVNGSISCAISFWEDIGYLKPQEIGYWKLSGKNSEFFDFDIPEISEFQQIISKQESKILSLLARGFNSLDIGRALKISRHTVDTHRRNMLRKLEVANTPELVNMARDMHIID